MHVLVKWRVRTRKILECQLGKFGTPLGPCLLGAGCAPPPGTGTFSPCRSRWFCASCRSWSIRTSSCSSCWTTFLACLCEKIIFPYWREKKLTKLVSSYELALYSFYKGVKNQFKFYINNRPNYEKFWNINIVNISQAKQSKWLLQIYTSNTLSS